MSKTVTGRTLIAAAIIGAFIGLWLSPGRAYAAETGRPYGGCGEAWQAPHSEGAEWCRDKGWTVRKRFVIGPKGYVHFLSLPSCEYEDSYNCFWNARAMGNKRGDSFIILGTERKHRIWYVKWMY